MDLNSRVRIGVSLNNVTGITGKTYELADLIAGRGRGRGDGLRPGLGA